VFSYDLLCGCEDHHLLIRHALVDFTIANASTFLKHCTKITFEEHTSRMKYETVWGTDIELHAIAAYLQLPIYVCTQRSRSMECYWECFKPLSTDFNSTQGMLHFPNESLKAS